LSPASGAADLIAQCDHVFSEARNNQLWQD
jgi:hypothetical protein